jgi:hypothetical protein
MRDIPRKDFLAMASEAAKRKRPKTAADLRVEALLPPELRAHFDAHFAGDVDFHALHAASGLSIEDLYNAFCLIAHSVPADAAARFHRGRVVETALAEYAAGEMDLEAASILCGMPEAEIRAALDVRNLPQAETRRELAAAAVQSDPAIPRLVAGLRERLPECLQIWLAGERARGMPNDDAPYELLAVVPDAPDGEPVFMLMGVFRTAGCTG